MINLIQNLIILKNLKLRERLTKAYKLYRIVKKTEQLKRAFLKWGIEKKILTKEFMIIKETLTNNESKTINKYLYEIAELRRKEKDVLQDIIEQLEEVIQTQKYMDNYAKGL